MSSNLFTHPLQHNGTSQLDRLLEILQPANLKLDDRSIQDLMLSSYRYAELIQYYDEHLQKDGDWRCFWEIEALTFLAYLAALNKEELLQGYIAIDLALAEAMERYLDPNQETELPDPRPDYHLQLIDYISRMAAEIERYYELLPPGNPMKSEILLLIQKDAINDQEHLQKALKELIGYHKYADDELDHSRYHGFISARWALKNQESYDCILPNGEFDRETLAALFQVFFKATSKICLRAQFWFEKELASPNLHQPHVALYLTFLNLFRIAQDSLNGLTAKHLNHYYENVLCLQKAPETSDEVHLIFELAQNVHEQLLIKGTELIAGKDGNGRPLIFELVEDWVVNTAKVAELKNTYFDINQNSSGRMLAGSIANSSDGEGGKFPDPSNGAWRGFGDELCLKDGKIGFGLASPQLILREGQRLLALAVVMNEPLPPGQLSLLQSEEIEFEIRLSSIDEWVIPSKVICNAGDVCELFTDIRHLDLDDLFESSSSPTFWAGFLSDSEGVLTEDQKTVLIAFVYLPYETPPIDTPSKVLIHGVEDHIKWPVAQIQICVDNLSSTTLDQLRNLRIDHFIASVQVQDIRENLVIQNEFGTFNGTQRFYPFGTQPKKDAVFYIGSTEIFQKSLNVLGFRFDWVDPPASLAEHYQHYPDTAFSRDSPNYPIMEASLLEEGKFSKPVNARGFINFSDQSGDDLPNAFISVVGVDSFTISNFRDSFASYGLKAGDRVVVSSNGYHPWEEEIGSVATFGNGLSLQPLMRPLTDSDSFVEGTFQLKWSVKNLDGRVVNVSTIGNLTVIQPIVCLDETEMMVQPEMDNDWVLDSDGAYVKNGTFKIPIPNKLKGKIKKLTFTANGFHNSTLEFIDISNPIKIELVSLADQLSDLLFIRGIVSPEEGLEFSTAGSIYSFNSEIGISEATVLNRKDSFIDDVTIIDSVTRQRYYTFPRPENNGEFLLIVEQDLDHDLIFLRKDLNSVSLFIPKDTVPTSTEEGVQFYDIIPALSHPFLQSMVVNDSLVSSYQIIGSEEDPLLNRVKSEVINTVQEFTRYSPTLARGFSRWQLKNQDFLHEEYPKALAISTSGLPDNSSLALEVAEEMRTVDLTNLEQIRSQLETIKAKASSTSNPALPNQPYTPATNGLSVSYTSTLGIESGSNNDGIDQFFYLYPFDGYIERSLKQESLPAFPQYHFPTSDPTIQAQNPLAQGNLYIGLSDLEPGSNISLLIQVQEGSEKNPDHLPPDLSWSYLGEGQEWIPFPPTHMLLDETGGLTKTGMVQLSTREDMINETTLFSGELYWLRIAAKEDPGFDPPKTVAALPSLVDIKAQVILARFDNRDNELSHLEAPLPAKTISKLVFSQSAVKSIEQPFSSFNGRPPEVGNEFYRRVSERLRHKDRAISLWDYERLLLQAFPKVARAKCITHTQGSSDQELRAGYVSVAVIPDLRQRNGVLRSQPRFSKGNLDEMRDFLRSKTSGFVSQLDQDEQTYLQVVNPRYEMVQVSVRVAFYPDRDKTFYTYQLDHDIQAYLSPWLYDQTVDIRFGIPLHQSDLLHFLESREYIDGIADLKMTHYVRQSDGIWQSYPVHGSQVNPRTSRSILTTFQIAELNPDDNKQGKDPNLTDHAIVVVDKKEDLC